MGFSGFGITRKKTAKEIFATTLLYGLSVISLFAQHSPPLTFQQHMERAATYSDASLFGPAIEETEKAISYAQDYHQQKNEIEGRIALAELMRKTGDFSPGVEMLRSLHDMQSFPELQAKRCERLAALYSEWSAAPVVNKQDSVTLYLDSALHLSEKLHLPDLQASIYNQMGFVRIETDRSKAIELLGKASELFLAIRDTHNYAGAQTNLLRCYLQAQDSLNAGKLIRHLVPLISNRKWYTAEVELYRLCASYENQFYHDPAAVQYWNSLSDQRLIANLEAANTAQVNAFRILNETRQLQADIAAKQAYLAREARRKTELIIFSIVLTVLIVIVLILLFRERKLRKQLKTINADLERSAEKYRLLMVESNHRIKNNLQMVISMLHFEQPQTSGMPEQSFQRTAQKIQTIGALHRHLSADEHNELVRLDAYFVTIIGMYLDIAAGMPPVNCQVAPVSIRSERIVYFGLILNEMLANTVAHSVKPGTRISVEVKSEGEMFRFDYTDGSSHNLSAAKGTGSKLIVQLVERIGGTDFIFDPEKGHYQFLFHGKN